MTSLRTWINWLVIPGLIGICGGVVLGVMAYRFFGLRSHFLLMGFLGGLIPNVTISIVKEYRKGRSQ